MSPEFNFPTTHVGSLPHPTADGLTDRLVAALDIPAWPQLTRRTFHENMYVQYAPTLPAIAVDKAKEKVYFDTRQDISPALEAFYTLVLEGNVEAFALQEEYAAGFFALLETLKKMDGSWAKGQVTGPISFGLTVTDQDLRASLYNELLADAIVKNMAMNARWQVRQLKALRPNVILFVDEPYMASFGSAFISLSREQVISYLDEIFEAIQSEDATAGVHCCANTDWGLLLSTGVDILNLDAYGYLENLALYPAELRAFLDRGGSICWGIVPNNEEIRQVTPQELVERLRGGIQMICEKADAHSVKIKPDEFAARSLIAPACGLGSTTVDIADEVLKKLVQTGEILQKV
jgi:methionine synthase II (cobalamin-independent)